MEEARHAFLAGAGVALDEDGGVAAGDPPSQRHQPDAAAVAHGGDGCGPCQFGDEREGEAHVGKTESDAGGQAIGRRDQRRCALDQIDENVAMGRMADFGGQQHAAAVLFTRAGRVDDAHGKESVFEPVLQTRNERADSTAHVER